MKAFDDYYFGYDENGRHFPGWKELIDALLDKFPVNGFPLVGESSEKEFIKLFGTILRALNILLTFDEFEGTEIIDLNGVFLDYRSYYNELHEKYRPKGGELSNINDDLVFEMELMKSIEINIDYILFLVGQLNGEDGHDREIIIKAIKSIQASPDLRNKEVLIRQFIESHTPDTDVHNQWGEFVRQSQRKEIDAIIEEENLNREKALDFIKQSFRNGEIRESGTGIADILPPMGLFGNAGARRAEKKKIVIKRLKEFFDRFFDISGGNFFSSDNL